MSFRRSIAAGFSIFASSAARSPISERASATSSGRWTNDRAIQSARCSSANCEVVAVLVGQRRDRHHHVGDVDALVVGHRAADLHFGDDLVRRRLRARSAGPCRRRSGCWLPGRTASNSSGCGSWTRCCRPALVVAVEDEALRLSRASSGRPRNGRRGAWAPAGRTGSCVGRWNSFSSARMCVDQLGFLLLVAVAHVDPERVGAGEHQPADHRGVARCRARASPGSSPCGRGGRAFRSLRSFGERLPIAA